MFSGPGPKMNDCDRPGTPSIKKKHVVFISSLYVRGLSKLDEDRKLHLALSDSASEESVMESVPSQDSTLSSYGIIVLFRGMHALRLGFFLFFT